MSRAEFRAALAGERQALQILPLLGRHAAVLEQVKPARFLTDPDTAARALHSAQRLYGLDAVFAGGIETAALAARAAAQPGDAAPVLDRRHSAAEQMPTLPDPDDVVAAAPLAHVTDLLARLRALLRDHAAIGAVLPSPTALARSVGRPDDTGWALDTVTALARRIGEAEPDLVLQIGDGDPGLPIVGICAHFGTALLRPGAPGVVAVPGDDFVNAPERTGWLWLTTSEIPVDTDPKRMTAAIQQLRSRDVEGPLA